MKKYLITGSGGFVAKHFLDLLEAGGERVKVLGLDVLDKKPEIRIYQHIALTSIKADLSNQPKLRSIIEDFRPDYVLHLAALSSVAYSLEHPSEVFEANIKIVLNLLESLRQSKSKAKTLLVGSSEIYGHQSSGAQGLMEDELLAPVNPYGLARLTQERLAIMYGDLYNLNITMTRSFNHFGPGQAERFVLSSIAKQLVNKIALKKKGPVAIEVGDVQVERDFTDVRDVVRAYSLLLKKGKPNAVYNVCSGSSDSIKTLIELMAKLLKVKVAIKTNTKLLRKNEVKKIKGNNRKILADCGWKPKITIEKSLADLLEFWGKRVKA